MSDRIDAFVSNAHYAEHLRPILDALPDGLRGDMYAPQNIARDVDGPVKLGMAPNSSMPLLVGVYSDLVWARRPKVLVQHGAGQTYFSVNHGSYAGGPGHEQADLFLCPNERCADLERMRYPHARAVAVGCPKLDAWARLPRPQQPSLSSSLPATIAVTFHWRAFLKDAQSKMVPEAGTAFDTWRDTIAELASVFPGRVLGHGHPKEQRWLRPHWDEMGIEYVPRAVDLLARADCLVLDNSCVTPDTPVLCEDLIWRPASELHPGDKLIGCDEERMREMRRSSRQGEGSPVQREDRRLRTTTVTANTRRWLRCLTVRTTHGDLTVSREHPWLVRRSVEHRYKVKGRKPGQLWNQRSYHDHWVWVGSEDLKVGDKVAHLIEPWARDETREGGWLAGLFDGEGCLHVARPTAGGSRPSALSVAQNRGPVLDELLSVLAARKVAIHNQPIAGTTGVKRCAKVTICGTLMERIAFLGTVRPERLIAKAREKQMWEGANLSAQVEQATVTEVLDAGWQEVCTLTTTERTFIADGFVAHNSLGFEWAGLDRPTVWLRGADWRPDDVSQHGGPRFGQPLPGPELGTWAVGKVGELVDVVNTSMERYVLARAEVRQRVYGGIPGGWAGRAAVAVLDLVP